MKRYLIINADDFGLCDSANEAVFDLFRTGFLKSSTIMMPCPKAKEAVKFAVDNPEYPIGVHLTMTNEWRDRCSWGSLTGGKTLENEYGRMWPENKDFEDHCTYKEAIAEVNAQIDFAENLGMKPVQLDNHMGSLYGMNGRYLMLPKVFKVCKKRHYPFRMCTTPKDEYCPDGVKLSLYKTFCYLCRFLGKIYNVPTPDYLILTDQVKILKHCDSYEDFRDKFLQFHCEIPEGITETFIHPAFDTDEMKHITSTWQRRYWEYLLMKDPVVKERFEKEGIELISYRELIAMKSK